MSEELREAITEFLWRVYGYPGDLGDAHPVTIDKYRADAAALEEVIEAAGFVLVQKDRWERARRVAEWAVTTPAIPSDVARPITLPGDLDGDV